jgi:hypothetical protein
MESRIISFTGTLGGVLGCLAKYPIIKASIKHSINNINNRLFML